MAKPKVNAEKISETANRTVWMVRWVYPPESGIDSKAYRVVTYPNSDLIYVETAILRRKISTSAATKLMPEIFEALASAQA
jgi:hypothetical protein